jgi:hypothetical protein
MALGTTISTLAHDLSLPDAVNVFIQDLVPPTPVQPPDPVTPANSLGLAVSDFVNAGDLANFVQALVHDPAPTDFILG